MRADLRPLLLLAFLALAPTGGARVVDDVPDVLRALLGDIDPSTPARLPDGRTVRLADALPAGAPRAGPFALPAPGDEVLLADVWVFATGPGPCPEIVVGPGSPVAYAHGPAFWIYEGDTMLLGGDADAVFAVSWVTHTAAFAAPGRWWGAGNVDAHCVEFDGRHLSVPLVNGVVTVGQR